jgi:anti-sigma regulatory factor (Ser/Thr protein kinase)
MSVTAGLWTETSTQPDHDLVRLHGRLSLATLARVRTVLDKLLADRGAVVVDLAALRLGWRAAVEVFPAALAAAGGWPLARLVLTGAGPELAAALRSLRIPRTVPLVDQPAAAAERLLRRPDRVTRSRDLPADTSAPAAARALVREVCEDWGTATALDAAALVANELVTNAVQHARTSCRLGVTLDERGLRVAVRDYAPGHTPRPRPVDATHGGGRGLHLVALLAAGWGAHGHPDGKTVWATIDVPPEVGQLRVDSTRSTSSTDSR